MQHFRRILSVPCSSYDERSSGRAERDLHRHVEDSRRHRAAPSDRREPADGGASDHKRHADDDLGSVERERRRRRSDERDGEHKDGRGRKHRKHEDSDHEKRKHRKEKHREHRSSRH